MVVAVSIRIRKDASTAETGKGRPDAEEPLQGAEPGFEGGGCRGRV